MPIETEFDPDKKRLLIKGSGKITFEEIITQYTSFIEAPTHHEVEISILDFSEAEDLKMNMTGAERLGEFTRNLPDGMIPKREAFVCANSAWVGLATIYSMVEIPEREFKVFRSLDLADAWTQEVIGEAA